jgi:hypothetical protein
VQSVWVVDPRRRKVYVADRSTTLQEVGDFLTLDGTQIRVAVPEIFGEIEEMEALG